MDKLTAEHRRIQEETKELRTMWFQQQLAIEKRKVFLETLKETK
ncbi:hypothetical protein bcgnr5376_59120 [Bacillus cereus]